MRWLVATFLLSENTTLPGSLRSQHRISGSYTQTHAISSDSFLIHKLKKMTFKIPPQIYIETVLVLVMIA